MLSAGKAQGIVKIKIRNPDNLLYGQVERELEKVFDLQEVIIVPSSALPDNKVANNPELGRAALKFMTRILRDGDYVGLSMGSALQSTARADFFDVHSNYLAQEFAKRFGGECVQFFAPALFSKESVLADFLKERTIRRVAALYQKLDVLIMGIGAVVSEHSTVLHTGYVDEKTLANDTLCGLQQSRRGHKPEAPKAHSLSRRHCGRRAQNQHDPRRD